MASASSVTVASGRSVVKRPSAAARPFAPQRVTPAHRRASVHAMAGGEEKKERKPAAAPGVANTVQKAAWYGVEAFGKVAGRGNQQESESSAAPVAAMSRSEVLDAILQDYEVNNYFVSGNGDMAAYDPDCKFSDPFVAFNGVERFKQNVSNLGAYLQDVELEILDWREEDSSVDVNWRFSCIIDLPWKPKLAAAGGTKHVLSSTSGRVVEHIESWDVDINRVLKSLLVPANRLPTNRWEVFMMSLSSGDMQGVWLALSGFLVAPSAALLASNALLKASAGVEILPGPGGIICSIALLAGVVAEIQKLTGVGTSNGGRGGGDAL